MVELWYPFKSSLGLSFICMKWRIVLLVFKKMSVFQLNPKSRPCQFDDMFRNVKVKAALRRPSRGWALHWPFPAALPSREGAQALSVRDKPGVRGCLVTRPECCLAAAWPLAGSAHAEQGLCWPCSSVFDLVRLPFQSSSWSTQWLPFGDFEWNQSLAIFSPEDLLQPRSPISAHLFCVLP